MMNYLIPKNHTTEIKIVKGITLTDIIIIAIIMVVMMIMGSLVNAYLRVVYYIFAGLLSLYLSRQSRDNPKKRIYQTLILLIRRDRKMYYSL